MNKDLRRLLELSGVAEKSGFISSLYEKYGIAEGDALDHQGPLKGLEGPFKMKNGREVYYDPKEGKYYDRRTDMYLSDEEASSLTEDTEYSPSVTLHARRGEERLNLKLEAMMEMRPMVTMLKNNGYDDFEMSDGEDRMPVDLGNMGDDDEMGDEHPDGEMVRRQMDTMKDNIERLCNMVDDGTELPAWVQSKLTLASEYLDTATDYLDSESPVDPDSADGEMGGAMRGMSLDQPTNLGGGTISMEGAGDALSVSEAKKSDKKKMDGEDPCWKDYEMVGTKKKNGKEVPNCVPKEESAVTEAKNQKPEFDTDDTFSKGQKVMYKGKEAVVKVPDAKADFVIVTVDGTDKKVRANTLSMPEKVDEGQSTYSGWKASIKKKNGPDVEFEGDKDICNAFVKKDGKRVSVGAWDGDKGIHESVTESLKAGAKVSVPHKGKKVDGKVVRYDKGDKGGSPFYIVDVGEEESIKVPAHKLDEAAVDATVFGGDQPYDAVDDQQQKDERTGRADRVGTKNKVPREVMSSIDKRITELKKSVERYDNNGYNEKSVKHNAIECLEQIKKNLGRGDHEGFMEAQIFFGTLMSPIWDMFPAQLVNYLAKGSDDV